MTTDAGAALGAVLHEERAAILAGGWARLADLAPRKAAGLAALAAQGPGPHLPPLSAALRRNQALLRAAIEGVQDAGRRGALLRSARAGFTTYDARGGRATVGAAAPRVERKA